METTPRIEELFEHTEWVRALAVRLCRDAAQADDVAQETWLRALTRVGGARVARAWLGGVARNVEARSRLRDTARSERERHVARPESVPGPDELLAQAELQRRVLAAVATLDESARQAILWRYYEGLSAEQIAQRLGQPSSTVRNRISRALEQLRVRLDKSYGERGAWLAIGVPLAADAPLATLTTGVSMASKVWVGAGAALLLAAVTWWSFETPTSSSAEMKATLPRADALPNETEPRSESRSDEPAALERTPTAASPAPRFERILVWGALTGFTPDASESTPQLTLNFADERDQVRRATLGPDGNYSIFGLTPGRWRVGCVQPGYVPLDLDLVLDGSSERVRHDLTLEPAGRIVVRWLDAANGEPLGADVVQALHESLAVIATRGEPPQKLWTALRAVRPTELAVYERVRDWPRGTAHSHADGVLALYAPPPLSAYAMLRDTPIASAAIEPGTREIVFRVERAQLENLLARAVVRCVDGATGQPAVGEWVSLGFEDGGGERAQSDEFGVARFERTLAGLRRVEVNRLLVSASRWVRLAPGIENDLGEFRLQAPVTCSGRVVGPDGAGLSTSMAYVLGEATDVCGRQFTQLSTGSAIDGSFDLTYMPAEPFHLLAWAPGYAVASVHVGAQRDGLRIELTRGVEVTAKLARGAVNFRSVRISDARGLPLISDWLGPWTPRRWTLASGEYSLEELEGVLVTRATRFTVGAEPLALEVQAR